MTAIIKKVLTGYNFVFHELADKRTKDWFLCAKPYQGLTLLGIYLLFVFKWGPSFMKNRQPYNLDRIMIVYNILQIIGCGYIFYHGFKTWLDYKWLCESVDYSDSEDAINTAKLVYYYYISKIIDLLDTVFFVFRKKYHQASFLHIYHHTGMVLLIWGASTYFPGGHGVVVGIVNCFVHVIMYSYYLLSVAIPELKGSLWLKKLVTQIQIVQFFLFLLHMGSLVFVTNCDYPRWTAALFIPQNLFMLILFVDFYIKTYIITPKKSEILVPSEKSLHEKGN